MIYNFANNCWELSKAYPIYPVTRYREIKGLFFILYSGCHLIIHKKKLFGRYYVNSQDGASKIQWRLLKEEQYVECDSVEVGLRGRGKHKIDKGCKIFSSEITLYDSPLITVLFQTDPDTL